MRSRPRVAHALAAATVFALMGSASLTASAAPTVAEEIPLGKMTSTLVSAQAVTVRFATFNVRTARADRGTSRHWLRRAGAVAREIKAQNPGIVSIQELGPGRADGKKGKIKGAARQTESLERALRGIGAGKYQLTRTTAYVRPGTSHGTQGTRILYDTSRFRLVSKCSETTGKKNYNSSCSMDTPTMGGRTNTRSAAYAEFADKRTGRHFFVISVHLDNRHSGSSAKERRLDSLRRSQIAAVYNRVERLNDKNVPVLVGGDINSWRTKKGSHAPFNYLTSRGFKDSTANASTRIDARYPTVNHWKRTLGKNAPGRQVALDVVMAKRVSSFKRYENVMDRVDSSRPSDHNMVSTDLNF